MLALPIASHNPNLPSFELPEYQQQVQHWQMLSDLYQGSAAWMRGREVVDLVKAKRYLPQADEEEDGNYLRRLMRSHYDNRFRPTVRDFAALLSFFVLTPDVPRSIRSNLRNVDRRGSSLQSFLMAADRKAIRDGHCFILTEYPKRSSQIVTLADEQQAGLRPYFVLVDARDLTNWDTETADNGALQINHVTIRERSRRRVGRFGVEPVLRYRVLYRGGFEVYEVRTLSGTDVPVLVDSGEVSLSEIPLVPYSCEEDGDPFLSYPPLLNLAEANRKHFEMTSEYFEVMHKCNMPTLVMEGMLQPGMERSELPKVVIGPNSTIWTPPTCRAYFVEPTGSAIPNTRQAIQDLEAEMDRHTLSFLSSKNASKTATEVEAEAAQANANLAGLGNNKESLVERLFEFWAQWTGEDSSGSIAINKRLLKPPMTSDEVNAIQGLILNNTITKQTGLLLLEAGDRLPKGLDIEAELAQLEQQQQTELARNMQAQETMLQLQTAAKVQEHQAKGGTAS